MDKLTKNQIEILDHTYHRAAHKMFCGDSKDMQILCKRKLMAQVGHKSFVPEPYFTITTQGIKVLREV